MMPEKETLDKLSFHCIIYKLALSSQVCVGVRLCVWRGRGVTVGKWVPPNGTYADTYLDAAKM